MILQNVLFPNEDICPTPEMYYRMEGDGRFNADERRVELSEGCRLDGLAYFNGFSIGKWRRYTRLDNLTLRLELKGAFTVRLTHATLVEGRCVCKALAERQVRLDERTAVELSYPDELAEEGIYAFSLTAMGEGGALFSGAYETRMDEGALNRVDIALDICTYRREEYVERNLNVLKRMLSEDDCELVGHLEAYIIDNGQTLDADRLSDAAVHICYNKNVGGTGGFARGMIEIMDAPKRFTHALLMDDDALFTEESLLRTYRLLRLLKPEYAGYTVAGALMRLDERYRQYECGGLWDGFRPEPLFHQMDMRAPENLLENEKERQFDYNGWWYCCIPMEKIGRDNLPLPLFVHRDDVEYGIRTGCEFITLNGVCVWHESFDHRFVGSMEYYDMRNGMIVKAIHTPGSGLSAAKSLLWQTVGDVVRYRYSYCEMVFRAIDDFCLGADHFMSVDPVALHREILGMCDKLMPIDQMDVPFDEKVYREGLVEKKGLIQTLRLYSLNGLFLPGKSVGVAGNSACWPSNFYRRGAVINFDENTRMGFVTRRDRLRTLGVMARAMKRMIRLLFTWRKTAEGYRKARTRMTSRAYWDEYLGL